MKMVNDELMIDEKLILRKLIKLIMEGQKEKRILYHSHNIIQSLKSQVKEKILKIK